MDAGIRKYYRDPFFFIPAIDYYRSGPYEDIYIFFSFGLRIWNGEVWDIPFDVLFLLYLLPSLLILFGALVLTAACIKFKQLDMKTVSYMCVVGGFLMVLGQILDMTIFSIYSMIEYDATSLYINSYSIILFLGFCIPLFVGAVSLRAERMNRLIGPIHDKSKKSCAQCGAPQQGNALFCIKCGKKF
ncbi:MAG: hypothetical protein ACFFAS_15980 [Promethearchaeota archaeon]